MTPEVRTERTFGVTAALKPSQRRNLLSLMNSEVYPDLLDVLEMVCIEMETTLINTDAADESAVLANHKKSQAAWQIFTHMQNKIADEANTYLSSVATKPPVPALTEEEELMENILNPTYQMRDEETRAF